MLAFSVCLFFFNVDYFWDRECKPGSGRGSEVGTKLSARSPIRGSNSPPWDRELSPRSWRCNRLSRPGPLRHLLAFICIPTLTEETFSLFFSPLLPSLSPPCSVSILLSVFSPFSSAWRLPLCFYVAVVTFPFHWLPRRQKCLAFPPPP